MFNYYFLITSFPDPIDSNWQVESRRRASKKGEDKRKSRRCSCREKEKKKKRTFHTFLPPFGKLWRLARFSLFSSSSFEALSYRRNQDYLIPEAVALKGASGGRYCCWKKAAGAAATWEAAVAAAARAPCFPKWEYLRGETAAAAAARAPCCQSWGRWKAVAAAAASAATSAATETFGCWRCYSTRTEAACR